jgi:hypothetical protein
MQATKRQQNEVVAEMNRIVQERFDGNLRPEAAIVMLAKQYGVQFEDKLVSLKESVVKNR